VALVFIFFERAGTNGRELIIMVSPDYRKVRKIPLNGRAGLFLCVMLAPKTVPELPLSLDVKVIFGISRTEQLCRNVKEIFKKCYFS